MAAYKQPSTVKSIENPGKEPNSSKLDALNISVGSMSKNSDGGVKTSGIVTRGNGAATKGRTARGPMA